MAALDFQGQTVWVTGAGKGIDTQRRWRLLRPALG